MFAQRFWSLWCEVHTYLLELNFIQEPAEDKVELLSVDVLGVPDILDLSHKAKQWNSLKQETKGI